jgi:hypothetical protein
MDKNKGVYIMSVASELVRLHPQTLRKYERCGHCGKSLHEIWIEQGQPYAVAVQEGSYPSESPVPLRKLTEAELKAMRKRERRSPHEVI